MDKNYPLTTTVGSYPVPFWLRTFSTKENLQDAVKVIFKTQELAGIDLVVDGELSRWDINHTETNGMIDYFIRPMTGIRTNLSRKEITLSPLTVPATTLPFDDKISILCK